MSSTNPFDGERPLRSEEDEIRKGVFSKALRTFAVAPLEKRVEWCIAIRDATTEKTRPVLSNRSPARVGSSTPLADGETEESRKRSRSPSDPAEVAEKHFTMQETGEYIGAFMRSSLDRVVGASLNSLSIQALRVLCLMLDIPCTAKSKLALYSALANYYYSQCEKIGKRVSKSTMLEEKTRQEAALMHLAKPPKRQKTAEVEKKAEKPEKSAPTKGKRKEQPPLPKRGGRPAHTNDDDVSEDELVQDNMVQRQKLRQTRQPVESSDEDSATEGELVIENNPSTFRKTAAPARPTAGEDDTWDEATLERRIASIVQLYDPVTVATVAKKLSGVGYSDPDMTGTVEAVLRKFQQRQLLFFDNGIAYLL